jgi:hypothetical protein
MLGNCGAWLTTYLVPFLPEVEAILTSYIKVGRITELLPSFFPWVTFYIRRVLRVK